MDMVAERLSDFNDALLDLLKRWDELSDDERKRQLNVIRQSFANYIVSAINWRVKARVNGVIIIRAPRLLAMRHFIQRTYHRLGHWLRKLVPYETRNKR